VALLALSLGLSACAPNTRLIARADGTVCSSNGRGLPHPGSCMPGPMPDADASQALDRQPATGRRLVLLLRDGADDRLGAVSIRADGHAGAVLLPGCVLVLDLPVGTTQLTLSWPRADATAQRVLDLSPASRQAHRVIGSGTMRAREFETRPAGTDAQWRAAVANLNTVVR